MSEHQSHGETQHAEDPRRLQWATSGRPVGDPWAQQSARWLAATSARGAGNNCKFAGVARIMVDPWRDLGVWQQRGGAHAELPISEVDSHHAIHTSSNSSQAIFFPCSCSADDQLTSGNDDSN